MQLAVNPCRIDAADAQVGPRLSIQLPTTPAPQPRSSTLAPTGREAAKDAQCAASARQIRGASDAMRLRIVRPELAPCVRPNVLLTAVFIPSLPDGIILLAKPRASSTRGLRRAIVLFDSSHASQRGPHQGRRLTRWCRWLEPSGRRAPAKGDGRDSTRGGRSASHRLSGNARARQEVSAVAFAALPGSREWKAATGLSAGETRAGALADLVEGDARRELQQLERRLPRSGRSNTAEIGDQQVDHLAPVSGSAQAA